MFFGHGVYKINNYRMKCMESPLYVYCFTMSITYNLYGKGFTVCDIVLEQYSGTTVPYTFLRVVS